MESESNAVSSAIQAVPVTILGTGLFGVPWADIVNILAATSVALQIIWFIYDKSRIVRLRRKNGNN